MCAHCSVHVRIPRGSSSFFHVLALVHSTAIPKDAEISLWCVDLESLVFMTMSDKDRSNL